MRAAPSMPLEALEELGVLPQWICYRLDPPLPGEKPKPRKTPIDPSTGTNASVSSAATWTTQEEAVSVYEAHPDLAGVGFVFTSADPYTGIDIDGCRDPESGALAAFARDIVARLDSYTEVSPSKTGLHIFVRAQLPPGGNRRGNLELYDHGRYFTVTSDHLAGTPLDIRDRQTELTALHAEIFSTVEAQAAQATARLRQPSDESDSDLWDRMFASVVGSRIRRLYDGDTSMHGGDDSSADIALCNYLAFWTGADELRMDRMFRQSALLRPKWDTRHSGDGRTYGQMTIAKAATGTSSGSPSLRVVRHGEPSPIAARAAIPEPSVFDMDPDSENEPIDVPPFPLDVLSGTARCLVEEAAAALVCAPDLIAVPLLVFAGATIGNHGALALKRDFIQRPNLFAACVAPPGKGKSPALGAAQTGINALQKRAAEMWNNDMRQYEADIATWGKEKNQDRQRPQRPEMEAFFTTDCTMEAAAAMLTHSAGVVMVRDELVQWVKSFDAYRSGRGGDRQAWLALWTGSALKIDRKTTAPIYVMEPCLAVVGGVQPEMLSDLREEAGRDDGFIDRLLWSYPVTPVHRWSSDTIAQATEDATVGLFRSLRSPTQSQRGPIPLVPAAQAAFIRWYDANSRQVEAAGGLVAGMYSKLPVQIARLALILHGLALPESYQVEPLSTPVMDAAIALGEYFRAHAHKAIAELISNPINSQPGANSGTKGRRGPVATAVPERLRLIMADGQWRSRKVLYTCLGHNITGEELTAALAGIGAERRAQPRPVGRPAEEWRLPT